MVYMSEELWNPASWDSFRYQTNNRGETTPFYCRAAPDKNREDRNFNPLSYPSNEQVKKHSGPFLLLLLV